MSEQKKPQRDDAARRDDHGTNRSQSSGSNAADAARGAGSPGTGDNPQDGKDTGSSGAARPRGHTEDPDRTL